MAERIQRSRANRRWRVYLRREIETPEEMAARCANATAAKIRAIFAVKSAMEKSNAR